MKCSCFSLLAVALLCAPLAAAPLPRLKVSDNHRFLAHADGTPFFYQGDTAWELFHRLKREDAEFYLKDRAGKHFNVIQAVVLAEFDGLHSPNAYGDLPLLHERLFEGIRYPQVHVLGSLRRVDGIHLWLP